MEAAWIPAVSLNSLPRGSSTLFKHEGDRVAVFNVDGEVFAVDDRCPHEGYPLTQGTTCGTTLTCCFHNFKFDLRDGQCLMGDEAVRTFPTRVVDGVVEIDVNPPDPTETRARHWRSLKTAMRDRKGGQIARDAVRLLQSGETAEELVAFIAEWDSIHAEYGSTHALPVAADLLRWLPRYTGAQAAIPIVQGLQIASEFQVRMPPRPMADPVDPGSKDDFSDRLQKLVEAEDTQGAEALFRGALEAGWGRDVIEPALVRLAADHFLDYGHALIYAVKSMDLLEGVGWDHAATILPAYLFSIVTGTREDILPAWKGWKKRQEARSEHFAAWAEGTATLDDPDLEEWLVTGDKRAESRVEELLSDGVALRDIAAVVSVAAARRVLRFDVSYEFDDSWRDNWLSVSHVQTFANATRHIVDRIGGVDAVRILFQAVRFVMMTAVVDGEPTWREELASDAERLASDAEALELEWMDKVVRDPASREIVVSHAIKQTIAGFEDFRDLGRAECALAAIRFCKAPKRERRVARATGEALALVLDGSIPKRRIP